MKIEDVIAQINKSVEELDFISARKYIEENLEILNEKKIHLKNNARELLDFLTERTEKGYQPMGRRELATINAINTYATKFDVRGLKMLVKDHAQLLLRDDVISYLNTDARIILEGMGAIGKKG
ncbi:hypothetical protein [Fredinandcohnia quinoae]|uniref:Uncharacterized protein n=1 Tax=Fredinandcohnia quinoae TaxID=2918902 RepID=A0AAW5EBB8_9BACI|nr:hypothetical protein [Fredinandcohnia sp. SECRCQ15]MCH1626463.1 hypothetical protein [Fredinandcohnia sp. SECRCQ15]